MNGKRSYNKYIKAIALSLAVYAVFSLQLAGCGDKDSSDESSTVSEIFKEQSEDISPQDNSYEDSQPVLKENSNKKSEENSRDEDTDSNTINDGNLTVTLEDMYLSEIIITDDTVLDPSEDKVFVIAELKLENNSDGLLEFWPSVSLAPSIDDSLITLSSFVNRYPDFINGKKNLLNNSETQISGNSSVQGCIVFETDKSFLKGELSYIDDRTVLGTFPFENTLSEEEVSEAAQKPEAIKETSTDTMKISLLGTTDANSEVYNTQEHSEGNKLINISLMFENKTDIIQMIIMNNFYISADGNIIEPFIAKRNNDYLLPEKYLISTVLFESPENTETLKLMYSISGTAESAVELFDISN